MKMFINANHSSKPDSLTRCRLRACFKARVAEPRAVLLCNLCSQRGAIHRPPAFPALPLPLHLGDAHATHPGASFSPPAFRGGALWFSAVDRRARAGEPL